MLVDGFVAPVGERERYDGLFSGKKHVSGHDVQVIRLRAAVERAISRLKNWKIVKTGYHRIMTYVPDVLRIVTALELVGQGEGSSFCGAMTAVSRA